MKYVLDANVYAKLVLNEKESLVAVDFISKIISRKHKVFLPSIFTYELIGVLKKHNISKKTILKFIEFYSNQLYLKHIELDKKIIKLALYITEKDSVSSGFPTFYDSVYHSLAMINNCNFITADKKHYEKVKKLGHIQLLKDV